MKRIYYISPVGTDKNYADKRSILERIAFAHSVEFYFPLEDIVSFSVAKALDDLRLSNRVIADLSMERPSCYFELGLAQALGMPVTLIASVGTRLHQAGHADRLIPYADMGSYESAIKSALSDLPNAGV